MRNYYRSTISQTNYYDVAYMNLDSAMFELPWDLWMIVFVLIVKSKMKF